MTKKTPIRLVPVVALIMFAMAPATAQATTAQAPAGTTLPVASALEWSSTNLVFQTSAGNISCANSELEGALTENGGGSSHVSGVLTLDGFTSSLCKGPLGVTLDLKTNVSSAPWRLQIQQPEGLPEQIVAHFIPSAKSTLQFTVQPQVFGFSTTTCDYTSSGIQLLGQTGSNVWAVTGTNQFTRQSGSSEQCGTPATLDGSLALTSAGQTVTVDMN